MLFIHHIKDNLEVPSCPRTEGQLGLGTVDAHRPCRGQPWMSQVVLGQMGHIGPGTDDALTDHVGNNLGCPRLF